PGGKQQTPSAKMKMPRDGARVPSFSKKASPKRSTIKCVRHPGQKSRATNQSHNSRVRHSLATCEAAARSCFTRFYVASPTPQPAQPARRGEWRANAFGARASDDDDLVFDSLHEVLLSTFSFSLSHLISWLFLSQVTSDRLQFFFVHRAVSVSRDLTRSGIYVPMIRNGLGRAAATKTITSALSAD